MYKNRAAPWKAVGGKEAVAEKRVTGEDTTKFKTLFDYKEVTAGGDFVMYYTDVLN
jgi:predicted metal-dependent peptidase